MESTGIGGDSPATAATRSKEEMGMVAPSPMLSWRNTTLSAIAAVMLSSVASERAPLPPSRRRPSTGLLPNTYTITTTESLKAPHCALERALHVAAGAHPVHASSASQVAWSR